MNDALTINSVRVKAKAVLVFGMHRSGTSAFTGVLNLLGVNLGERLIGGIEGNNRGGFWEHADAVDINDRLLRDLGRSWHDVRELPADWLNSTTAQAARKRVQNLVRSEFTNCEVWGLKDPRLCLLAELWVDVLQAEGFEVVPILVLRHPEEVAKSLYSRDGMTKTSAYMLWGMHVSNVLRVMADRKIAVVDYAGFLHHWRDDLAKAVIPCGLDLPLDDEIIAGKVHDFLKESERHNRVLNVSLDTESNPLVETVNAIYECLASRSIINDDIGPLRGLLDNFNSIAKILREPLFELFDHVQMHAQRATLLEGRLARVTEKIEAVVVLQSELTLEKSESSRLGLELSRLSERMAREHELHRTELDRERQAAEHLERLLSRKEESIRELTRSTSWRITAPLRWVKKLFVPRHWRLALGNCLKAAYEQLPLATHRRLALKGMVFRALAPMIRNTRSYRAWQAYEAHRGGGAVSREARAAPRKRAATESLQDGASMALGYSASRVLLEMQALAGKVCDVHVALDDKPADLSRIDVRAIAFYLPQFHPIPENDEWWGRGFTEWTNVSKAAPQFVGHYQPRLPGELGFYDLRLVDVMRRQVELARHYGLQGFCFHYYWFGGRRLLERPLQQFLDNPDIDFPFCVCWANENWSRRWDGKDQEILVAQNHSPEDDIAFITALEPLLRDPRYIRVDSKPLIVLYRPSILPDAKATQQRWREHCRQVGIGEIMLAMVQFDVEDPRVFGFDVAIEFPPHKLARGLDPINDQVQIVNPDYSGYVIDYDAVIERAREHEASGFEMIRGVFPSWDNEARKPGHGYTFANATPARYREWLDLAIDYSRNHPVAGERMVFINAWNEWAEGAYLEPDRRYGYAYLEQTRQALLAKSQAHIIRQRRVALVSHDANPHGAQYLALNLARELKHGMGMRVDVLLMAGGELASAFAETAQMHDLSRLSADELDMLLARLRKSGVELVIANSAVSGRITRAIAAAGLPVITLVHELPKLIRDYGLEKAVRELVACSNRVVLPSKAVAEGLREFVDSDVLSSKLVLRPQGLFTRSKYRGATDKEGARAALRRKLGLKPLDRIVLAVAYADRRKGVDLLLQAAALCCKADPSVHFVWVGHTDASLQSEMESAIENGGLASRFHFVGMDFQTDDYYAGADLYALPSREDPFPSVVLESLSVGTPVVAFAGAGGGSDLVAHNGGVVVPAFDIEKYAQAITALLGDEAERKRLGGIGIDIVDAEFSFRVYAMDLLHYGGMQVPRVSVVVPNFNYARYLAERLASVTTQSVPIYEIIFLDDGSTDDSIETIQRLRHDLHPEPRIVVNQVNSGSVFVQWQRGVQLARGDFVWIAEADDLAKPDLLEHLLQGMVGDPDVVLAYCQSEAIDDHGALVMTDYLDYTAELSTDRWANSYVADGAAEVDAALGIKNTIPNVSAVLFRRQPLLQVMNDKLEEITSYKVAGDWAVYLQLLLMGKIFYSNHACNRHRRHHGSVTKGTASDMHYREVVRLQESAMSMFSLSDQAIGLAQAYRASVREYLGISNTKLGGE